MELIDQHTKKIMEGCKARAKDAGLSFQDETLEYIVTNRDLLELSPKMMIPTFYDYWVHDVDVLKEKGKYELYPSNPYETVINTRPAISFYNDNNPDWLNVMIFYHVLAHIDFFQNNLFFEHTWNYDFNAQALSDKRVISKLRAEKGRWVDYIIEFTRGIDNIVGFYDELSDVNQPQATKDSKLLDFYFDIFLQKIKKVKTHEYIKEIERYNEFFKQGSNNQKAFFFQIYKQYPEFKALYNKHIDRDSSRKMDLIQYILKYSPFLNKDENNWMRTVIEIVRNTSLFFQPQIRTKIMNEGWASFWHETLFLEDDRIEGHEVDFAKVHAFVTSMPRVGLNPYALGMRLFNYIKEMVDQGKYSLEFRKINNKEQRCKFNRSTNKGNDFIFKIRKNFSDYSFINTFVDQDFISLHKLFVVGKRLNTGKGVWEYYVKSRRTEDYREMLTNTLYHPPYIKVDQDKSDDSNLYLNHYFEGIPLVNEFISNTMLGIEYLWGGPVQLETSELEAVPSSNENQFAMNYWDPIVEEDEKSKLEWRRVLYKMDKKKLNRKILD